VIYWNDEIGSATGTRSSGEKRRKAEPSKRSGRAEVEGVASGGQTSVLTQTGQKFAVSMIAAVCNRCLMRFSLYEGALNDAIFLDFLKRRVKHAKPKAALIVDKLRVHPAEAVMERLGQHKQESEICYLPAYAQEHKPSLGGASGSLRRASI